MAPPLVLTPEELIARAVEKTATDPGRVAHPTMFLHAFARSLGLGKSDACRSACAWSMVYAGSWANPAMIPLHTALVTLATEHPIP